MLEYDSTGLTLRLLTEPWQVLKRFGGDGTTNCFNLIPEGNTGYFRIHATNGNALEVQ